MSIVFACSHCRKQFTVPDDFAGKKAKCKGCGGVVQVPRPTESAKPRSVGESPPKPALQAKPSTSPNQFRNDDLWPPTGAPPQQPASTAPPPPKAQPRGQTKAANSPKPVAPSQPARHAAPAPVQPVELLAAEPYVATAVETSLSGAPIYRYEGQVRNRRRVSRDAAAIRAIADHVRTYVGMVDQVLEADSNDLLPVDLHLVAPRRDLPIRVAVTSGMSNHPMNTPHGAENERHMELVLGLEPTWPVSKEALSQDHRAWPLEWLRSMACLPHTLDTWLGIGHTVPNGDPPQPLGPGTEMCGWILLPSLWLPEEFGTLVMHETKTVYFYAILPLYREEMDFKLQQGAEALFERLSQLPMLGLFDFQRPNVCKATMSLACAACGTPFETPAEMAGQRVACPRCGGAVIVPRRGFYDEKQRSVTLDDQSTASLPGNVKVNPIQYVTHFPLWPILWAGSLVATGVAALLTMNIALILIAFMLLAANGLYWYRVKEHFLHGCINPAVVVSTNPLLIAVSTDLTTGWKPWPVVKILPHPLRSLGGQTPQIGMRLSTVALYQSGGNDDSHWVDFHPQAVECVTTDEASIQYTMSQLDEDAWQDLHRKLMKVPRPFQPGLYHTPDE